MKVLLAFLRERYPPVRYVPLAAALAYVSGVPARGLLPSALAAWMLLAGLRLRDDLADLASDRVDHPGRLLSGIHEPRTLYGLHAAAVGGAVASFVPLALTGSIAGLPWLLLLIGALELAYVVKLPGKTHWVLLKYPAVLPVLRASAGARGEVPSSEFYMGALVLGSMLVFEWSDDPELRRDRLAPWVIALGCFAVLLLGSAHLDELGLSRRAISMIASAFCAAALWVLARGAGAESTDSSRLGRAGRRLALHCALLVIGVATCERLLGGADA